MTNQMGRIKQKRSFEHAQNAKIQITLRICKVSAGPLLSVRIFCGVQ